MATGAADEKLREAFAKFDTDGSGYIEAAELREALRTVLESCEVDLSDELIDEYTEKVMTAVDTSGDGKISFDEFVAAFRATEDGDAG